jgi:CIC family chloride channel protein
MTAMARSRQVAASLLSPMAQRSATWLRGSRLGLVVMALAVGATAGLGAVAFRWLIFAFTWLATGHQEFGQNGRIASDHLPWLGIYFVLLVPVLGGLIYGPLIQRFAREARGHGVPEVMLAVAENGGRIRPPVTLVKAVASALCIGVGGSVGREGPIVQIGSALASTLGQVVRMSETKLRIIVACGAAGGISATFNAPITGLFFGFEIVLREFSLDALFATMLSAVTADLISRAFFGGAPFFSAIPHNLALTSDASYLLMGVLALGAGLVGVGFKTSVYGLEDLMDRLWKGRPEWARPAVGGLGLGLVLLAIPQMYGVGYPVMDQVIAGKIVIGVILLLVVGKVLAASLTLAIGGSGGVFAPSLFTGAAAGYAYGLAVQHLFGPGLGSPAIYAVVAMGGVFAAAAQAPLTAMASVVEMTGNFTLTLSAMLVSGVAAALSKRLTYGSIYTTKLLRRGIDIERATPATVLQTLTVGNVMQRFTRAGRPIPLRQEMTEVDPQAPSYPWGDIVGPVTDTRHPQVLFSDETLAQALRQLVLYGRSGLPVLTPDAEHMSGWLTRRDVLRTLADALGSSVREAERGTLASRFAEHGAEAGLHVPSTPLEGYELVEITMRPGSPALGKRIDEISWPSGCQLVAVTDAREVAVPRSDLVLKAGERVLVLAPARTRQREAPTSPPPPTAGEGSAGESSEAGSGVSRITRPGRRAAEEAPGRSAPDCAR